MIIYHKLWRITRSYRRRFYSNTWHVCRKVRRKYPFTVASSGECGQSKQMDTSLIDICPEGQASEDLLALLHLHQTKPFLVRVLICNEKFPSDCHLFLNFGNHLRNGQFSSREAMAKELQNFSNSKDHDFCKNWNF